MKYTLLVVFSFLVFGAFAQNSVNVTIENEKYPATEVAAALKAGEIVLFENKSIDLGKIKKGAFPEMTFRFLNIGKETIEYSFFDVCSCSELTYDKSAKIKPGEEGSFHIVFDSKEREDEEPVEVNFELTNIDKRNNYPFFYTVNYTFSFL